MRAIHHLLEGVADKLTAWLIERSVLFPLQNRCINPGGLVIKAGGSAIAKTVTNQLFSFNRAIVKLAAGDCAAIPAAPVIPTANAAVCVFTLDSGGNKAALLGNPAATLALAVPPPIPAGQVPYGMLSIENATGGNFTGGTTALDTGSLTVTFADVVGQIDFDPLPL